MIDRVAYDAFIAMIYRSISVVLIAFNQDSLIDDLGPPASLNKNSGVKGLIHGLKISHDGNVEVICASASRKTQMELFTSGGQRYIGSALFMNLLHR